MKKLTALLIAVLLFLTTVIGMGIFLGRTVDQKTGDLLYYNADSRNRCLRVMKNIFAEDGVIPVFGSSELSSGGGSSFPSQLFQEGNSDFNMILIGRGGTQSLLHAINLGAMADQIPDKKAVLILSPQWFTEEGAQPAGYSSLFSEGMFVEFLKNTSIPLELRTAVSQRIQSLLVEALPQLERVQQYDASILQQSLNPVGKLGQAVYVGFLEQKEMFSLIWAARNLTVSHEGEPVKAAEIDYDVLREAADREGEASCSGNDFYIKNDYYERLVEKPSDLDWYRGTWSDLSYAVSPEYEDLALFLEVCKATGITPLIVSVPVHGYWYDQRSFPKEGREAYYENIRELCEKYDAALADFSDKEYEPFFLRDIMHVGWKGWAYIDEAVYQFYKQP